MEEDIELRATIPVEKYGTDVLSSSGEGTPVDGGSTPASSSISEAWLEVWHSKSRRGALKPKDDEEGGNGEMEMGNQKGEGEALREEEDVGMEKGVEVGVGGDGSVIDIDVDGDGGIRIHGNVNGRVVRLEGCATV